jgi:hypothetical protein
VYIIHTKRVIDSWGEWGGKNAGNKKMKEAAVMLLKTNGLKMSETILSTILMKRSKIQSPLHYVDDNEETYQNRRGASDKRR